MQERTKKLSVDEIIEKIKTEVAGRQNNVEDLMLKQERFVQKECYEYQDFTKYRDDLEFIKNLYLGLLKREVDKVGLQYYLDLLRKGKKSKEEIVSLVRYSKEGREKNINLLGSKKRYLKAKLYAIPVVGYIVKLCIAFISLPKLLQKIDYLEKSLEEEKVIREKNDSLLQREMKRQTDILQNNVDNKLETLEHAIDLKIDKEDIKNYLEKVHNAQSYLKSSMQTIETLVSEAKKRLPHETFTQAELIKITEEEKHFLDMLYVAFEDKFRGTRSDIKERLSVYFPYLEKLPFEKEKTKILDLGCGRGEWLELLNEQSYKAEGIDLNRIMVAKSKELGLAVKEADVICYLESLEADSVSMITGFHIIEHLPFEILMKMFKESYRVLQSGGIVIFETPNPENLLVGACSFYTDPTHRNPLVPETSAFLLESSGFDKYEIKRLNKYCDYYPVSEENEFVTQHFYNEMDYAVIGYK